MNNDVSRAIPKLIAISLSSILLLLVGSNLIASDDEKPKVKQTKLMIMDADGSNLKVLFKSEKFTGFGSPAFSPDGKKIAMDAWEEHRGQSYVQGHIIIINSDGTGLKDIGDGGMPSWSGDGKKFAISRHNPHFGVWTMDADGTNREVLDPRGWGVQWSTDVALIAYTARSAGGRNITIYDTQEDTFRFLIPFENQTYMQYYWNGCWSADGKSFCFKARTKEDVFEIVSVEVDKGTNGLKVHFSDKLRQPSEDLSWHPDGSKILCILNSPEHKTRKMYTINALKREAPKLLPGQTFKETPRDLCWSPDGKTLIFTMN